MIGKTILHYKVVEKLGEGGMGVVYKGEDTKLDRTVAIKLLPAHLLTSADDRARFSREAKAAAALNHPNIATVYEINEYEGKPFIVMEYVEGKTLNDALEKELFKLKNGVSIAIQVAEGLKAAHAKNIVHRDIKSGNILLSNDGQAKILDFGLAKTAMSTKLTRMGSTLGTVAYMSPEQVSTQSVDHRTDLWSLGVVIFEMLTGRFPFSGEYDQAIFYNILNEPPEPLTAIRSGIPMSLEWIVNKLLAKNPDERYQNANDLIIDLKAVDLNDSGFSRVTKVSQPNQTVTRVNVTSPRKGISFWLLLVAALAVGFAISYFVNLKNEIPQLIRASIEIPENRRYADEYGGNSAIPPDGTQIVFAVRDSLSQSRLWVRRLNSIEPEVLAGTDNASYPFWSPNSQSIGFFADGKVKTIDAIGGPVLTLADAPFGRGGAWSKSDEIIFSPSVTNPNLYGIPISGGKTRQITSFDSTQQSATRFPFFLPDGKHFLFSLLDLKGTASNADIYVGSLDSPETIHVLDDVSYAQFASGFLLYLRQGILIAQEFDPDSYALTGNAKPLQANINSWSPRAKADFSVSENGILLYSGSNKEKPGELIWISTDGHETPIIQVQNNTKFASLSPDGSRIAYEIFDYKNSHFDTWVYDINSKSKMRITFGEYGGSEPCWSIDGRKIYYNVEVEGNKSNVFVRKADGTGDEELLTRAESGKSLKFTPLCASPDKQSLLIRMSNESNESELGIIDLLNTQRPIPIKSLGISATRARFSPDGKWIVYSSYESGSEEIYVSSFKGNPGKWQLSANGGSDPEWFKDKIIYYSISMDRYEMLDVSFVSEKPVFDLPRPIIPGTSNVFIIGISKDGKRFLCLRPGNAESAGSLSLVINWQNLLKPK